MKEENNSIYVKLDLLDANVGQVEGVPENPRKITAEKWDRLMDNVLLYPEYLRMNRLKCLEYNNRYVVLGGNQRRDVLYAISTMGENELLSCIKKAYEDIKPEGFEDGDIELMFEYWKGWQTKKDVPIVVTRETDIDTLKAYVALDNNSFGKYDWAKVKQGGCASYRNRQREMEQFKLLQKKWGSQIIRVDEGNSRKNKKEEQKYQDYNPILKTPIRGI